MKIIYTSLIASLIAFPVATFAQESTSTDAVKAVVVTTVEEENPFTLCSQEAIEQRDTEIAKARSLYNTQMNEALQKRKEREKKAVAMKEGEKKQAIKVSAEEYRTDAKTAQNELSEARKEIWKTFEEDVERCREAHKEARALTAPTNLGQERKAEVMEIKSFKDSIRAQIESLKALFQ